MEPTQATQDEPAPRRESPLTDRNTWIRFLYMLLFGVVLQLVELMLGLVAIVLLLYVIVVGPLTFRWVQRRNAPALALVTTPAVALGCFAVLLAVGYVGKGVRMRYRRVALRTLRQIQERGPGPQAAAELAVLLKKTALAAWPRTRVASLSGDDWSNFLVHTGASKTAAQRLSAAAYSDLTSDPAAHNRLCEEAARWIRGHQVKAQE